MSQVAVSWHVGDRVQVSLPYGQDSQTVHLGYISRIRMVGPVLEHPNRIVKVMFDDPLIYGGTGHAWVDPKVLSHEGGAPASADRD